MIAGYSKHIAAGYGQSAPIAQDGLTMSSRDIAELTDKRHDHVMRDIEKMLSDIGLPAPKFGGSYTGADNTTRPCYNLPEDLTLTLISGYRADLRYRIVKDAPRFGDGKRAME